MLLRFFRCCLQRRQKEHRVAIVQRSRKRFSKTIEQRFQFKKKNAVFGVIGW